MTIFRFNLTISTIFRKKITSFSCKQTYQLNDTADSFNADIDDETMDPDWVKTPMFKSRRKTVVSTTFNFIVLLHR